MIRTYYYNENCLRKSQVAGVLIRDSFDEFDELPYEERVVEAGFPIGDCSYFEGDDEEDLVRSIIFMGNSQSVFHRNVFHSIRDYFHKIVCDRCGKVVDLIGDWGNCGDGCGDDLCNSCADWQQVNISEDSDYNNVVVICSNCAKEKTQ